MNDAARKLFCFLGVLMTGLFLFSCGKTPVAADPASLVTSDIEYSVRQTHENSYVLDVKGKIKNTGALDVKNVVVTGYCRSCILEFSGQKWFVSDVNKTENQKDTINYLAAGGESAFSFEEVAFYFTHEKKPPESLPEKIEITVESFETVQGS